MKHEPLDRNAPRLTGCSKSPGHAIDATRATIATILGMLVAAALILTGCDRREIPPVAESAAPNSLSADSLVVVDGRPIPMDRWESKTVRSGRMSPEGQARRALDELILREQLVARALREGLDKDPDVRRSLESAMIAKLKERELKGELSGLEPDDAPSTNTREASTTRSPDQVRLAVLRLDAGFKASAEKVRRIEERLEEARAVSKTIPVVDGFGSLAVSHSEDPETRMRGGDLGWLDVEPSKYNLDPAVMEAGLSLSKPGEVSQVVRGKDALYVVRLMDRRRGGEMTSRAADGLLARHKAQIEQRRSAEEAFLEETRRMIPVTVNTNLVEQRIAEVAGATAPSSMAWR